ncbi:MAG: RES family NAD+ phosphorylase [Oceanicaulis sp.]|uniref:RES family NAD+ phosphorylase n=1 Tax=Glycocaulis sp. TaxID=1969725 RepID=UPI0025BEC2B0|nr:RES family NAD+ phosphorylase [Glycocaulis sp.]MCC5982604.1 RES family NAD+ phosphorylase [Oceanicaulis sp.]MCH8522401.1 RES family NAD+ phosphorylase [Glycocaulis sp.]
MAKVLPPKGFASSSLQLHVVPAGERFGRIYLGRYPDPLGVGKSPSRFSDPRRRIARNRFGVLYLGETVKVCFLEAVLRDQRDGVIGDLPIAESELHTRLYAEINVKAPLNLVDLRGAGAVIMGVPTDVAKASRQTLARNWSLAFHEHKQQPDGIIYPSRLNNHTNLAVFDRAISKLQADTPMRLIDAPGLGAVLNELNVGIAD